MEKEKFFSFFPLNRANGGANDVFSKLRGDSFPEGSDDQIGEGESSAQSRSAAEIARIEEKFAEEAPFGDPHIVSAPLNKVGYFTKLGYF